METVTASVTIDRGASPEELEGVRRAFREVGVDASVRAGYVQMSELPPWMVMTFLPITAFLSAVSAAAGKDAYEQIKRFIKRLREARASSEQPPGNIILEDTETKVQVVLSGELPDEAIEALFGLDIKSLPAGPLSYDLEQREWVSFRLEWEERKRRRHEAESGT